MDRQQFTHKAQAKAGALLGLVKRGPVKLLLIIGGGIVAPAVLALVVVNLPISAEAVRDPGAERLKEQTRRQLKVNGPTPLPFPPRPPLVLPPPPLPPPSTPRPVPADISGARLALDLNLSDLFGREVDAKHVVVEQPVITIRLGSEDRLVEVDKPKAQDAGDVVKAEDEPKRDMRLNDLSIEDG